VADGVARFAPTDEPAAFVVATLALDPLEHKGS
jgi:hypothetical protein